jgi:ubiquinone biosynthesis protein
MVIVPPVARQSPDDRTLLTEPLGEFFEIADSTVDVGSPARSVVQSAMDDSDLRWSYLAGRLGTWTGTAALHLAGAGADSLRDRIHGRARHGALARRLGRVIVHLGPTFVKGGQLLSTRSDILPPSWCGALGRLHDRVGAMPLPGARRTLERAYPQWPFEYFDWTPVASGSIACVYRARLPGGRDVAVKVRRPGIARQMHADFRLLGGGARLVQAVPGLRKVPMRPMMDQIARAVLRQLDLVHEAETLQRLRENLDGLIRVPRPLPEVSGDGVLVMEFVEGLARFGPGEFTAGQRRAIVRRVLHGIYRMLFLDGLVHCDMHPGNLYLTRSCDVVLLDAGFVVRLAPRVRRLFAEFFLNMAIGRGDVCAEIVLRSADHVPAGADLDAFRRGIEDLVRANHRRIAGQFRLGPFATRLFDLQRRSGIAAAPEFVFPLLSLLVLEGMVNDFDVKVDFQAEAVPTLLRALRTTAPLEGISAGPRLAEG